ncbi:hypothetical protein [Pontimicrobium sp. SW4]|uniref:NnrS family protein n=1 Tax=Pontimicrobium sp. SW4 TaxID=3153519 RepID=A0AAU7BSV5_9FLAO
MTQTMKYVITNKQLWFYPILFGFLGTTIGLVLRYAFTGEFANFPFKNVLHSHSHVMLLGFLFNALVVLIWGNFTSGIDKKSYQLYLALQVCVVGMLITFIIQGYALFSILFSTLHLWISYVLLIRLWKRLQGNRRFIQLIKVGILFHFISSIGPYCLGPLMAMGMQDSPWYQQSIFFYLHFQYFGSLFIWFLVVLLQRSTVILQKRHLQIIAISLIGLYTHSLDYSFNHWAIQLIGSLSSIGLLVVLLSFWRAFMFVKRPYQVIYFILLFIAFCNIIGSHPFIASQVEQNRFLLIAWLHLLFLGLYVPFIWIELKHKISNYTWIIYSIAFLFSQLILVFPNTLYNLLDISVMWLLFIAYFGVFLSVSVVHLTYLFKSK